MGQSVAILIAIVALSLAVRFLLLPAMQRDIPRDISIARSLWQKVSASRRSTEANSLRELERACRGADLVLIRRTLNTYLAAAYDCSVTQALQYFRRDADAAALLDELNATLYASNSDAQKNATMLAEKDLQKIDPIDILLLAKRVKRSRRKAAKVPLPPLFST